MQSKILHKAHRRAPSKHRRVKLFLAAVMAPAAIFFIWFNWYVNFQIKPTLHQLAEYQAREVTARAINEAVSAEMQAHPERYTDLYTLQNGHLSMNAAALNTAGAALLQAVQNAMDACPLTEYSIPFGSLTNNTLLGGLGPVWLMQLQPQGYAQGNIHEVTESLSINTTRYSAVFTITVTVNMVLDGRTATLTVGEDVPLATYLLSGEIPELYAADFR